VQSIVYPSVLIMCLIHWMVNDSKENCVVSQRFMSNWFYDTV
jgi:hypothetical protein